MGVQVSKPPSRARLGRALRVAECALLLGGTACLLAYAGACAQTTRHQARDSAAFDRALQERIHREIPDTREWSSARVERFQTQRRERVNALGRLEIPRAEISVMVLDGTEEEILDRAVGRVEGTAKPGEPGNVGIAGHRDGWFRGLRHLEPGDPMTLTTLEGVASYEVEETLVVAPTRVDVLEPSDEDRLTLITCYPFYYVGDAPERYIVRARKVSYAAWPRDGALLALQKSETQAQ